MKSFIVCFIITFSIGCSFHPKHETLTSKERHICDSLKMDTSLIILLRPYTTATIEPFHYSLSRLILRDGTEKELDPVYLPGIVFKEKTATTETILNDLSDTFRNKGYSIFVLDRNYGIRNKPDVMGILKTTNKYEVLKSIQTDGANYEIDTDSLVSIIKSFDSKYSLELVGASGDWCEFKINKEPADWLILAREAYMVCPDIVDQGAGTVEALADEMKRTRRLYFWWD